MTILSSDCRRIMFESSLFRRKQFTEFSADILNSEFRGRRSIWWCWTVTSAAPRNANNVSYVTRINHESHFSLQAQYLVKLDDDSWCSAHCTGRFMSDKDQSSKSFLLAGAVLGEGGVSLFVAGTALREILIDSRSAKCCIFPYKMRLQDGTSKVSEAAGARWRFHARIILGSSSNRFYIGGSKSRIFRWNLELRISWQAQYLVRFEADSCCSAHCK